MCFIGANVGDLFSDFHLTGDAFKIVEVAKWPVAQHPGQGLQRSYCLRIASDKFITRKHFEIYKVRGPEDMKVEQPSDALVPTGEGAHDIKDSFSGEGLSADAANQLTEVKRYLREMSNMEPDEYKAAHFMQSSQNRLLTSTKIEIQMALDNMS